jgi:hypothetical protein
VAYLTVGDIIFKMNLTTLILQSKYNIINTMNKKLLFLLFLTVAIPLYADIVFVPGTGTLPAASNIVGGVTLNPANAANLTNLNPAAISAGTVTNALTNSVGFYYNGAKLTNSVGTGSSNITDNAYTVEINNVTVKTNLIVNGTLSATTQDVTTMNVTNINMVNSADGSKWTNVMATNIIGAVAQAVHTTNADLATLATTSSTSSNIVAGITLNAANASALTNLPTAAIASNIVAGAVLNPANAAALTNITVANLPLVTIATTNTPSSMTNGATYFCTGTGDSTIILSAVGTAGDKTIRFLPGDYFVGPPIWRTNIHRLTLLGDPGATIHATTPAGGSVLFRFYQSSDIRFDGLRFNGHATDQGAVNIDGIWFESCYAPIVSRCHFTNFVDNFVGFYGSTNGVVSDSYLMHTTGAGHGIDTDVDTHFSDPKPASKNISVYGNFISNVVGGVKVERVVGYRFEHNTLYGTMDPGSAMFVFGPDNTLDVVSTPNDDLYSVFNNRFYGGKILFFDCKTNLINAQFCNNYIEGWFHGAGVYSGDSWGRLEMVGNTFRTNGLAISTNAVYIAGSGHLYLSQNRFIGFTNGVVVNSSGIVIDSPIDDGSANSPLIWGALYADKSNVIKITNIVSAPYISTDASGTVTAARPTIAYGGSFGYAWAANGVRYFAPNESYNSLATEGLKRVPCSTGGCVRDFYTNISPVNGVGTNITFWILTNGVSCGVTCAIMGGSTNASDTVHVSNPIPAGCGISIMYSNNYNGTFPNSTYMWGFKVN